MNESDTSICIAVKWMPYYGIDMFGNAINLTTGNINTNKSVNLIKSELDHTLHNTHNIVKDTTGISIKNNLDDSLKYRKKHNFD